MLISQLPEETLEEKIYKLRKLSGLIQKQFAIKCNIGYSTLCRYETGCNASKDNLIKICTALNIDNSYLL